MGNHITYGTPEQLGSLLRSIYQTAAEEPDSMYRDSAVLEAAEKLGTHLLARVRQAKGTTDPDPGPAPDLEHEDAAQGFLRLFGRH